MARFLGISLLFLGLGLAAYDGFRGRDRVRDNAPVVDTGNGTVHADDGLMPPN